MSLKRFEDIIAYKSDQGITAFHARNLEVADVSEEIYSQMTSVELKSATVPSFNALAGLDESESFRALKAWSDEQNPAVLSGHVKFGIKSLTLNVTQICNLKCNYCAAGGDGTYGEAINKVSVEKTLPQLKFFLESLKDGSVFNLSFVGGEPFLYPQAMKVIYDYVLAQTAGRKIECRFMVTTNGTLITDAVVEMLKTMRIYVTVSLDGTKEINDIVRPSKSGRSSTDATLKGLKKLVAIRPYLESIGIAAVVTKQNSEIKQNYLFFKTLNVDWCEFNYAYAERDVETQNKYLQQMQEIAEIAWQSGGEEELRKIRTINAYFDVLDSQQRIENFCGAGKSYLMIDAKNRLYTCPWLVGEKDEIVGENSVIDYDKLDKYQKPLIELNNCNNCWARFVCGGGCMYVHREHTGDKHLKDELFCERTRGLILLSILYYKRARAAA
ncbi:MAG: radical SAM protein [Bdellovibrionaceae bacterium]|nr:radical SAM protein [Bdellovibrio sp.]